MNQSFERIEKHLIGVNARRAAGISGRTRRRATHGNGSAWSGRDFHKGRKQIGKATLRKAFERAMKVAKLSDFTFRDFCHCAVEFGWRTGGSSQARRGGMAVAQSINATSTHEMRKWSKFSVSAWTGNATDVVTQSCEVQAQSGN